MEVTIEKLPKRYAAAGKKTYEVFVDFPKDFKSNIFTRFEIDKKYKLLNVLGAGACGLLLSATDKSNGEKIAIKKLDNIFRHPDYTVRVVRELLIHRRINHPFIVAVKDIMRPVDKDTFSDIYIVMDMVKESLSESISKRLDSDRRHQVAPLNVKLIMNELLRALQYLHAAHVLHRDLKPENILMKENQTVKLCDFGLARITAPQMTETVIVEHYRPPELFLTHMSDQSNYGPAIDIWSLGCIFADMLLGRLSSLGFSGVRDDIENLKKIAETIPLPDDDDLSEFIDNEQARVFVKTQLPRTPSLPLSNIFMDVADKSAVDLLERMLVFNPRKRISIEDALRHEYMAEITVDVLARKLNLKRCQVEKLKKMNPPHIEMFVEDLSQSTNEELREIMFDSCLNSEASRTLMDISRGHW